MPSPSPNTPDRAHETDVEREVRWQSEYNIARLRSTIAGILLGALASVSISGALNVVMSQPICAQNWGLPEPDYCPPIGSLSDAEVERGVTGLIALILAGGAIGYVIPKKKGYTRV